MIVRARTPMRYRGFGAAFDPVTCVPNNSWAWTGADMAAWNNCKPTVCATDTITCNDGSVRRREASRNCGFNPCPEDPFAALGGATPPLVCAQDIFTCPDDSTVSRDPSANCAFKPCPQLPTTPADNAPPSANPNPQPISTGVTSFFSNSISILGFNIPLWLLLAGAGVGIYAFGSKQ